ncbi:MAG: nuclear transport factor 2 family protein [Deltaproteobacteria bacterium]|nr:nuclear transport factor 2 family protein [Deltaproteobacteria bacterium]
MRRLARALAVLAVVTSCSGSTKAKAVEKPLGPAIDEKTAKKDASGLVEEIYDTINRGKPDNLFSLLNDPLIVFGPRKVDGTITRSEALVALGQLLDPKSKSRTHVRSASLAVMASQGGRSAWAFDVLDVEGKQVVGLAVLTNDDDLWAVSAATLARTPTMREIRSELKKVAVVPPGAMSKAPVDDRADGAVEKFKRGLLDQNVWGEDLSNNTAALVVGPTAGDVTKGKKDIKRVWKKRMDAETRAAISGEVSANITPDGQLAWVTAPITRVEKDEEPLPLRAFAVFEKDGGNWKMIALHESLALDEPGAGAAFVKILPPAPKAPEPPPEVKDDKKDKKKDLKKKKDKKKKGGDGDELKAKKKKKTASSEDDEETPRKKTKKMASDDEDEDKPKKKKLSDNDDGDDEKPKKKKASSDDDEVIVDDEDEKPKKKRKKRLNDDDE